MATKASSNRVRYAVVGLGHIAQVAVLPAFKNARNNSELAALVSGDPEKLDKLGRRYGVAGRYSYNQFEDCLQGEGIDAVFIALPNHLHCEYTVRAAEVGVHVLCEKPLAVTARQCDMMIRVCALNQVRLMTAYRLHMERANLEAIEAVHAGRIGNPQIFNSLFSFHVRAGDTRTRKEMGGGTLYDIGVYCINAARNLFRDEPLEVFATSMHKLDERSAEVDAITNAVLRFPGNRTATFTTSFASAGRAVFEMIGTEGRLVLQNAYEYQGGKELTVVRAGKTSIKSIPATDQFAGEIAYFSECILRARQPEPDGEEGLADVRIVEALYQSARTNKPVQIDPVPRRARPTLKMVSTFPPVHVPPLVNTIPPGRG